MKKIYLKILTISILSIFSLWNVSFWQVIKTSNSVWVPNWEISQFTMKSTGWDSLDRLSNFWFNILHTLKIVVWWMALIYLVFLGFQMMMAMWADDKLSTTKRQLYYTLIAFIFINIPGSIYEVLSDKSKNMTDNPTFTDVDGESKWNIFINFDLWNLVVRDWIIGFVRVFIVALVIYLFTFAWISYMSAWAQDDKKKKAKWKFIQGFFWLIFLWIMQAWIVVVHSWDIPNAQWLFAQVINLWIFFTGPVAIFFLILWWFYYITSSGDEAKAKKWIAIIKYTFIWVIILLASYTFLKDLSCFTLDWTVPTYCK
ncbi:MAG: hypothetical protein ACD_4C00084G0002 [uncultured bacterium (gcode 4)]|uniref:Uncharacterized protein n=1 Tax=uncultured bacterium (gcode 4) TaxID=1234023 RepID=K2GA50_9BACT|nr:MAG: hypothetical protein ACD_4C00084G0002 [uncultured bacterium (gcode 4)]